MSRPPDHPRACGANLASSRFHNGLPGSSPRVRGKPHSNCGLSAMRRIIPARAGQTPPRQRPARGMTDHPRACGANVAQFPAGTYSYGSSPRVRGKQRQVGDRQGQRRIIPARAGQTPSTAAKCSMQADHPRACGANQFQALQIHVIRGSSPRVRGKLGPHIRIVVEVRIIPARAGQTPCSCAAISRSPDHPRACGANPAPAIQPRELTGSSPRVRGKLSTGAYSHVGSRIIPARAGQTLTTDCISSALEFAIFHVKIYMQILIIIDEHVRFD